MAMAAIIVAIATACNEEEKNKRVEEKDKS